MHLPYSTNETKSLNSFLAQNVLKLPSIHSFEWAREKNQHFFHISSSQNTCYNTDFGPKSWNSPTFPWLSWYLKFLWQSCKIPWFFPDQWPPWCNCKGFPIRCVTCCLMKSTYQSQNVCREDKPNSEFSVKLLKLWTPQILLILS